MSTETGPMVFFSGQELVGHRILGLLGRGGFGVVYEALDLKLQRRVALKVLQGLDVAAAARFSDEAILLARINDPHVVQVYQVGTLPTGQPFITMEIFGDGSLTAVAPKNEPAPLRFAVSVTGQVLRGLGAAHAMGVVHRDIKGANILVDKARGVAKLCDFGIARCLEPLEGEAPPTGAAVLGTPHFIAPERFQGVRDDPRSDLYAVGVVFYQLLTGRRPFEMPGANALMVAQRVVSEDVAPPPGLPPGIARVLTRLLARDPEARYPTAAAALEDLGLAWRQDPTAPQPLVGAEPLALPAPAAGSGAQRRGWAVPALALSVLALGAVGLWRALVVAPTVDAPQVPAVTSVGQRNVADAVAPIVDVGVDAGVADAGPEDAKVDVKIEALPTPRPKILAKISTKAAPVKVAPTKATRPQKPAPVRAGLSREPSRRATSPNARTSPFVEPR